MSHREKTKHEEDKIIPCYVGSQLFCAKHTKSGSTTICLNQPGWTTREPISTLTESTLCSKTKHIAVKREKSNEKSLLTDCCLLFVLVYMFSWGTVDFNACVCWKYLDIHSTDFRFSHAFYEKQIDFHTDFPLRRKKEILFCWISFSQ